MYDIEATVTKSTPTELKFTGENDCGGTGQIRGKSEK
jgi:hypothetical protein